jgi:dihydroorotate dehydrogenase electron transfer subunit
MLKDSKIVSNKRETGDYFRVIFDAPEISQAANPGQFVHVKIFGLGDRILRRPFSICDCSSDGRLEILYKVVGEGTKFLSELKQGSICNLMGPNGTGFSNPAGKIPVLVTGGYGSAATFMLSKTTPRKGFFLAGAKTADDILLAEKYKANGFDVEIATDDGSVGEKGFVTKLLENFIKRNRNEIANFAFYSCGPEPMLLAVAGLLTQNGVDGELSLDRVMCCGVGACLACVVKIKSGDEKGWRYSRTCIEGPVFKAGEIYTA